MFSNKKRYIKIQFILYDVTNPNMCGIHNVAVSHIYHKSICAMTSKFTNKIFDQIIQDHFGTIHNKYVFASPKLNLLFFIMWFVVAGS